MEILVPAILVLGIYHTIRIYLAGRKNKEQFPAADYLSQSSENSEQWRWRKPNQNIDLKLVDDKDQSSLVFDPHFCSTDYIVSVLGAGSYIAAVGFLLFGLWFYFFGGSEDGLRIGAGFTLSFFAFIFGSAGHTFRQRVCKLSRTNSDLVLEYSYGTFFTRKILFSKKSKVNISVKEQSIVEYENSQTAPSYELLIAKKKIISFVPVKFYIPANQSQITWIQGGLNDWFNPQNNTPKNTEIFTSEGQNNLKETVFDASLPTNLDTHL